MSNKLRQVSRDYERLLAISSYFTNTGVNQVSHMPIFFIIVTYTIIINGFIIIKTV